MRAEARYEQQLHDPVRTFKSWNRLLTKNDRQPVRQESSAPSNITMITDGRHTLVLEGSLNHFKQRSFETIRRNTRDAREG